MPEEKKKKKTGVLEKKTIKTPKGKASNGKVQSTETFYRQERVH